MGREAPSNALNLERFLATIYVDPAARARFLASPEAEASRAGLSEQQCLQLKEIDFTGLKLASKSFARKRAFKQVRSATSNSSLWRRNLLNFSRQKWFALLARLSAPSQENRKPPLR